jgi:hypothetical protein
MNIGEEISKGFTKAVDKVVELRYEPAQNSVEKLRQRNPQKTPDQLADLVVRRRRKELGAVGAASGGVAAVPMVGTGASLAAMGGDTGWMVLRIGEMILELGVVYGHDAESIEERRAWVMSVLSLSLGIAGGIEGVGKEIAQKGGVQLVKKLPMTQIVAINRVLGGRIVVKWGANQGVIRLGRLIPFGVGAVIGLTANAVFVTTVGTRAKHFFDDGETLTTTEVAPRS